MRHSLKRSFHSVQRTQRNGCNERNATGVADVHDATWRKGRSAATDVATRPLIVYNNCVSYVSCVCYVLCYVVYALSCVRCVKWKFRLQQLTVRCSSKASDLTGRVWPDQTQTRFWNTNTFVWPGQTWWHRWTDWHRRRETPERRRKHSCQETSQGNSGICDCGFVSLEFSLFLLGVF